MIYAILAIMAAGVIALAVVIALWWYEGEVEKDEGVRGDE